MDPTTDPTLATRITSMAPIDMIGLVLLAVLIGLGLWRGLWWQLLRLAGIVAAVLVARIFSPETSLWVMEQWDDLPYRLAHGFSWLAIFLLTLGAASILGLLGQRILEAMQLGLFNRIGGGIVGALTGVIVHMTLVVAFCQLAPARTVEAQVAGSYTQKLVDVAGVRWRVALAKDAANEVDYLLKGQPVGEKPVAPKPVVR